MNTTALDNDKLNTVVTETTDTLRRNILKCAFHFDKLTQLSEYFFPHMLPIFLIIATANVFARLVTFHLETGLLMLGLNTPHKPLPLDVTPK